MSFILDALRKSEHARQRQTGPGLAEVAVASPPSRTNVWATAAVVLLLVNLLVVGVLLLRRAQRDQTPAATVTAAAPATTAAVVEPPVASSVPATTVASPTPAGPPAPGVRQAADTAAAATPPASGARNPLAEEVSQGATSPTLDPTLAEGAASVPPGPPAVVAAQPKRGSVVYAPIPEASDAPYTNVAPEAPAAAEPQGLPTADEIAGQGGLPALHLDLHVYAATPAQRFVFVNSRKYREGDTLQEGPVVEQITRDGAVLMFRGHRFRLSSD